MLVDLIVLVVGFILLIKGADFLVGGASSLAEKFRIPGIIIGLTIVAFGTSAPEAAISISAGLKGSAGICLGNVMGSNILNILLILGITSCIVSLKVAESTVRYEIPFTIFITIIMVVLVGVNGKIGLIAGIVLWILFIIFMMYLLRMAKKNRKEDQETCPHKMQPVWVLLLVIVGGLAALIIGSNMTVDSASSIARTLGMSERLIGLTIVAFGTSLPELVTSVTAARRGEADIAIGNIVGSNIFNILFVLGTTALITTVPCTEQTLIDGIVCIIAAVLLWICVAKKKELRRGAGILFLVTYGIYFAYLLM